MYDFKKIEEKWQRKWEKEKTFKTENNLNKKKYYVLEMFPYPSGKIHMGHVRNYSIGDAIARFRRKQGFNVIYPMGWDSFGLPAENAAIETKIHPKKWTENNINYMKQQLKRLGFSYDWDRETATYKPDYYKWNQYFFIQFYKNNLVYRKHTDINFCPKCDTVLANEQVHNNKCWRCDSEVIIKKQAGWFFKTRQYADELLNDLENLKKGWPEEVLLMQKNWIGKSTGASVNFPIENSKLTLQIFTTRPDTLFGVSFMAIAADHPFIEKLISNENILKEIEDIKKKAKLNDYNKQEKNGVFTGVYAINPLNNKRVPIWVADYVLTGYGTGAIMAVPAHDQRDFEFAKKYNIEIIPVIKPLDKKINIENLEQAYEGEGIMINSNEFNGLNSKDGANKIIEWLEKNQIGKKEINYKLRDWGISRQRFWGTPIPIVYCPECSIVLAKEDDLPIMLPENIEFTGKGNPLEKCNEFINTKCPKCGRDAKRETDTMDTFVDSSWYFLRYINSGLADKAFNSDDVNYFMPVDQYIGGIEHACMHLLYARFFTKALRDIGLLSIDEPFKNLLTQGMVCKETYKCPEHNWVYPEDVIKGKCKLCNSKIEIGRKEKMSKSKKNVVDPSNLIEKYGADTARLFILFASPPEKELDWSDAGVEGSFRFLNRLYNIYEKNISLIKNVSYNYKITNKNKKIYKKFIWMKDKFINDVSDKFHFNTAIAGVMEFLNVFEKYKFNEDEYGLLKIILKDILILFHIFTPHLCCELWGKCGFEEDINFIDLPQIDKNALIDELIEIPIQINGKLRNTLSVKKDEEQELIKKLAVEKVGKYLENKEIRKIIYIKNKIINIVVK